MFERANNTRFYARKLREVVQDKELNQTHSQSVYCSTMVFALLIQFIAALATSQSISDLDLYDFESSQKRGFRIIGEANGDAAGISVNVAGDVNNDGLSDIIIKSIDAVSYGGGASYILFGQDFPFNFTNINLADMVSGPSTGFRMHGGGGDTSPRSVAAAGDVNNDGIDDFIIGAPRVFSAYVIYGSASETVQDFNLSTFVTSPETGFKIIADNSLNDDINTGWCVSLAGDINGDHILDLIVSDQRGREYTGANYIIFGNYSRVGDVSLNRITELGQGFRITGMNIHSWSGHMAVEAGDINGDGIGDILIGSPFANPVAVVNIGVTYVLFGRNTSVAGTAPFDDMQLSTFASGAGIGYRIIGSEAYSMCGWGVAGLGDMNLDGYSDIILSTWGLDVSYVMFGRSDWTYQDVFLSDWDSTWSHLGFRVIGAAQAVNSAGDVNGDGFNDILCSITWIAGVPGREDSGVVYVIYGQAWQFPYNDIHLDNFEASVTTGFRIIGAEANHMLGISISSAGDFNEDGCGDMIVSTPTGYSGRGGVFIVFGESTSPTGQPCTVPSVRPTRQPSRQPSSRPTGQPFAHPTSQPSSQPTMQPTLQPIAYPTSEPSGQPSERPTRQPTLQPTTQPSAQPSTHPNCQPSVQFIAAQWSTITATITATECTSL